ncbi:MAG: cytochrome c-type biogenesis protein CcmH, partial [Gammaproteobacteria bacterium]
MRVKLKLIILLLSFIVSIHAAGVLAKEAEPLAADPEMEKRVNAITAELRCLVCQNQTIADSHAALAVDLKNQVRQMVGSGKTQDQIVDYMVKRYGDFVRYRPPVKPTTYLLWAGPFILLVVGVVLLISNLRKRKQIIVDAPLSADENDRLQSLLGADATV